MSNAEQLAATLNACERSGIWYKSSDAANELRRLQAEVERLTAENAELRKDAERYRWLRKSNSSGVFPYIARDCWNAWGKLVTRELRNKAADDQIDKATKETP